MVDNKKIAEELLKEGSKKPKSILKGKEVFSKKWKTLNDLINELYNLSQKEIISADDFNSFQMIVYDFQIVDFKSYENQHIFIKIGISYIQEIYNNYICFIGETHNYLSRELKKMNNIKTEYEKKLIKSNNKFVLYYKDYCRIKKLNEYSREEKNFAFDIGCENLKNNFFAFVVLAYRNKSDKLFINSFTDNNFEKFNLNDKNNLIYYSDKFYNSFKSWRKDNLKKVDDYLK